MYCVSCCLLIFSCNGASKSADTSVSETQKVETSSSEPANQKEEKPFVTFGEQDTVFLLDRKPDTIIYIDCKTIYKEIKHSRWNVVKLNVNEGDFEDDYSYFPRGETEDDYFPDFDGEHLYWVEERKGKDRAIMKLHKYNINTMEKVGTLDFTSYLRKFMPMEDKHGVCNQRFPDSPFTGCRSSMRLGRGVGYISLGLSNGYGEERTRGMNYFIIDSRTFKIVDYFNIDSRIWFTRFGELWRRIYYSENYFMVDLQNEPIFIYNMQDETERIVSNSYLNFENGIIYKYYRIPQKKIIGMETVFIADSTNNEKAKIFNQVEFGKTTAPLIYNQYCHVIAERNNVLINMESKKIYNKNI